MVCGEPSADLQAANLAKALKTLSPQIKVLAVGGENLRQAGADVFYDIKELSAIGFFDVIKKLPKFFELKKIILAKIKEQNPDAVILVDFSGFNLRLAKAINKSLPTIYFISPQVWASRPGRVKTIKKYIHKMIVLFKFEEEFYQRYGMDVDFIGHPLLDIVRPTTEAITFLNQFDLSQYKTTIALLPGSRKTEVRYILPIMLEAASLIKQQISEAQFVVAKSPQVDFGLYNRLCAPFKLDLKIIEGLTYDCLNIADFALVASGTATLETAIMQKPFLVIYRMNNLNYFLYRPQIKLPFIGMVNIVAQRKIIPEFIQFQALPQDIAQETVKTLTDPAKIGQIKKDLSLVKSLLGQNGASLRAAKIIIDFLSH